MNTELSPAATAVLRNVIFVVAVAVNESVYLQAIHVYDDAYVRRRKEDG